MKLPESFPPGCKFFDLDDSALAVVFPDGKPFRLIGEELLPARSWPPLSEPAPLSEAGFFAMKKSNEEFDAAVAAAQARMSAQN